MAKTIGVDGKSYRHHSEMVPADGSRSPRAAFGCRPPQIGNSAARGPTDIGLGRKRFIADPAKIVARATSKRF